MGKLAQTSVKYLITAEFDADGTVEKRIVRTERRPFRQ